MPQNHTKTELESYKDAVWDFILEHCDITDRGSFFVKFHISDRRNLENRIMARWKYGYHRKDDRTNFDIRQKERDAEARRDAHISSKIAKARKHQLRREERNRMRENIVAHMQQTEQLAKMPTLYRVIHTLIMQPLAQKWYNVKKVWRTNRLKNQFNHSSVNTAVSPLPPKQD